MKRRFDSGETPESKNDKTADRNWEVSALLRINCYRLDLCYGCDPCIKHSIQVMLTTAIIDLLK
jgi:hypothetical protein